MANFALLGAAGFVAPRHLKAIADTQNTLAAAADPHDSVGVLDRYFPNARFFTEIERFDRHLEKLRRKGEEERVHYVSICSPNYLHDAHVRLALRLNAHAICEKPLVISPWNLDQLAEIEAESQGRVFNTLQLRYHPTVMALKERFAQEQNREKTEVVLTYITRRGAWYHTSWKGDVQRSGGLGLNIGVHFFDLLISLFGSVQHSEVHLNEAARMSGALELEWARVRWFLSVDVNDLPHSVKEAGGYAFRALTFDGQEIDLSSGFTDLHTEVYRQILKGNGPGIEDARPSCELVYKIRNSECDLRRENAHPILAT